MEHIFKTKPKLDDMMIRHLYRSQENRETITSPKIEVPEELNEVEEQIMIVFTLRQLSSLDKGIQALHAVVEYGNLYGDDKEYQRWSNFDKTVIIKNGGAVSSMTNIFETLTTKYGLKVAIFNEPDLDGLTTAIAVLIPSRIHNPDIVEYYVKMGQHSLTRKDMEEASLCEWFRNFKLAR